jgi:putative endonuclease
MRGRAGLGEEGEELAIKFLKKNGYRIIQRNYRTPIGEIDIIARDGETMVFVEVKTRESMRYGLPFESIGLRKRQRISNVAALFLRRFKEIPPCRFDVVSICYEDGRPRVDLIKGAFDI